MANTRGQRSAPDTAVTHGFTLAIYPSP